MKAWRERPAQCAFLLIVIAAPAAFGAQAEAARADRARRCSLAPGSRPGAPDMSTLYREEFLPDAAAV
jgi:hypothetical protein